MRILWKFVKKYWIIGILGSLFMIGEVAMDLLQPGLMEQIVDRGILGLASGGAADPPFVIRTGIRMVLFVLLGGFCGVMCGVCTNIAGQHFGNDLRKDCFARVMHFSFQQTDAFSAGSLITRITNDITQIQTLVMQIIRGCVRSMMLFAGGTYALLRLNLSFGAILACTFPVIFLDIVLVVWKTNPLFSMLQRKLDSLNGIMQEDVAGIRVVKAFVQEKRELARFGNANDNLVDIQFRVELLLSFLRPVMNIVLNLATVGIIYIGRLQVEEGSLAPGAVMAAITYISQILNGMMMLAMIFQTVSRGMVSTRRVQEILDTEPALSDGPNRKGTERGTIRFDHVSFCYPQAGREILHDVSFSVKTGETLGIIGATGSGKSTLVDLIPRFYDVTGGCVFVNGIDVREYQLNALREAVTICLQKSELFSTTIRENIAVKGRRPDDASADGGEDKAGGVDAVSAHAGAAVRGIADSSGVDDETVRAAKAAQADDFIREQPDGYDTAVAEGGMSLSGGQRQRIAIARALQKGGDILIFDDSTSALDLRTEAALYKALRAEYGGVTKLIIAQRIASVRNADRILVLDHGRVSGLGTHEELMRENAIYRDIYQSQLREEEEQHG